MARQKKKTKKRENLPIQQATPAEGRLHYVKTQEPELYERCSKVIGMSDEMIKSYPDVESLKRSANGMHSKSDPDARVKEGVRPEPPKFPEMLKDVFTLESVLEAKFIKTNREHYDRGNLQQFLLLINRRYGTQKPIRIVEDKSLVPKKRELVTHYTIYFMKG